MPLGPGRVPSTITMAAAASMGQWACFFTPRESGQATSTVAEFVNEFDATALTSPQEIDAASASNTSGSGLSGFEMVPPEDSQ